MFAEGHVPRPLANQRQDFGLDLDRRCANFLRAPYTESCGDGRRAICWSIHVGRSLVRPCYLGKSHLGLPATLGGLRLEICHLGSEKE
jgi:hypothetical protein